MSSCKLFLQLFCFLVCKQGRFEYALFQKFLLHVRIRLESANQITSS